MQKFRPTHRDKSGKNFFMECNGGLYTFPEWSRAEACDYSFSDDGELLFQGQPSSGQVFPVSQEVADAYEKMLAAFDLLSRVYWDEDDSDLKKYVFTVIGKNDAKGFFDPDDMVDYFVNL